MVIPLLANQDLTPILRISGTASIARATKHFIYYT